MPIRLTALALLALFTLVNVVGIRESSWVNAAFTIIEALGLVIIIWLGIRDPQFGDALATIPHDGVLAGAGLVFFAYLGFEEIANLAEDARDPGRTIPRAILLSVVVTTILYVLVALASVALVRADTLAESQSPLARAAAAASPVLARILGAIALFATANTALVTLLAVSRLIYGMARGGDLPATLGRVTPKRRSPWVASLILLALASAALPLGKVEVVGSLSSLGALIGFIAVNVTLILLRRRDPDRDRPFRVPLAIRGIPVLPVLGTLSSALLLITFEWTVYLVGAGIVAFAFLFLVSRRWWSSPRTA